MMEKIKLRYTFKDYIRAKRFSLKNNKTIKYIQLSGLGLAVILGLLLYFNSLANVLYWLLLLVSLYLALYPYTVLVLWARRQFKGMNKFNHPIELDIRNELISEKTENYTLNITYASLMILSKDMFLVYYSRDEFLFLHKKQCEDSDVFDSLLTTLRKFPRGEMRQL